MKAKTILKNKANTVFITFIAIILFSVSFIFISSSYNFYTTKKEVLLNYNSESNIKYLVNLKENNYFSETSLKMGEQYITSLIRDIEIDYNYKFNSDKKINGSYKYKIVARVNADHKVDSATTKKIWSKDYDLFESDEFKLNDSNEFKIKENININYDKYNEIVNNFKKDYMIALTSRVDVYMFVYITGMYDGNKFIEDSSLMTRIPLSEQTINITNEYIEKDAGNLSRKIVIDRFNNIYLFILGIILFIVGCYLIIKQVLIVLSDSQKQSEYIKKLKKYLHDYDDIIATVKHKPKTDGLKEIEFVNFEELIDAQDNLRVPIIFCETKKNERGYFYLISQECAYFYVLKDSK